MAQGQGDFFCDVTPELSLFHVKAPFPVTSHVLFSSPSVPIPNRSCNRILFFPSDSSNNCNSSRNNPSTLQLILRSLSS